MGFEADANVIVEVLPSRQSLGLALFALVISRPRARAHQRTPPGRAPLGQPSPAMRDIVYILVVIAFFALAALFVRACNAIVGGEAGEAER